MIFNPIALLWREIMVIERPEEQIHLLIMGGFRYSKTRSQIS
jgi:hypothetical protein